MKSSKHKTIVGRSAIVDFPDLGLLRIKAKIDTGAYSTALHSDKVWENDVDGTRYLFFQIQDPENSSLKKIIKTQYFTQKSVKSSNGKKELRYQIKTNIVIGGKTRKTDVSLTNRKKMKFPVLIGRKVLKNGFLVDVSKKFMDS